MSKGLGEHRSRSFSRTMKRVTALTAGVSLASTAGCLGLFSPPPGMGGGRVPGGAIPHQQEIAREDAHVEVTTPEELVEQANQQDGRIIWVPNDATIDMTGRDALVRNVTIASGRTEGVSGGLITTSDMGSGSPSYGGGEHGQGVFEIEENGRMTGLELRGPTFDYTDSPAISGFIPFAPQSSRSGRDDWRAERHSRAVSLRASTAQIDNCEVWGWSTQAIAVGSSNNAIEPTIHHCAIHNNGMMSLGYGVDVRWGNPLVYKCYFDANRHSLNGHGNATCGYRAIQCTFGPHVFGHIIDMHRVGENNNDASSDPSDVDWQYRAGGYMLVRGCTIQGTHNPVHPALSRNPGQVEEHVAIRGVPEDGFYFENNWCAHAPPDGPNSRTLHQSGIPATVETDEYGYANMYWSGNTYNVQFDVTAYHQPEDSPYSAPSS